MSQFILFCTGSVGIALVTVLVGCSGGDPAKPTTTAGTEPAQTSVEEDTKANDAMAKLSPADRAKAEIQKMCPVSNEPLGSMGTPIKVTVEGRDVFVCCEGCVDELKANFAKYADQLENKS
jgi:hypothetical protein